MILAVKCQCPWMSGVWWDSRRRCCEVKRPCNSSLQLTRRELSLTSQECMLRREDKNRVKGNWTLSELWGQIGREVVGDVGWKGSGPDVPIPTVKIIRSCFQLFYITVRFFKAVILLLLKLKNNVAFLFMSFSWLRRGWNSPVIIVGVEDEGYQLTIEDIDLSLVFMYIL